MLQDADFTSSIFISRDASVARAIYFRVVSVVKDESRHSSFRHKVHAELLWPTRALPWVSVKFEELIDIRDLPSAMDV